MVFIRVVLLKPRPNVFMQFTLPYPKRAYPKVYSKNSSNKNCNLGSGCGKATEHTPRNRNSTGHGFDSCQLLGIFSSLYAVSNISTLLEVHLYKVPLEVKQAKYANCWSFKSIG